MFRVRCLVVVCLYECALEYEGHLEVLISRSRRILTAEGYILRGNEYWLVISKMYFHELSMKLFSPRFDAFQFDHFMIEKAPRVESCKLLLTSFGYCAADHRAAGTSSLRSGISRTFGTVGV